VYENPCPRGVCTTGLQEGRPFLAIWTEKLDWMRTMSQQVDASLEMDRELERMKNP
jgi:hypothetical protein